MAIAALVLGGTLATDAQAQRRGGGNWVDPGCKQVSFMGRDRDTIQVGHREGRFKAIRLEARNNDVEML